MIFGFLLIHGFFGGFEGELGVEDDGTINGLWIWRFLCLKVAFVKLRFGNAKYSFNTNEFNSVSESSP